MSSFFDKPFEEQIKRIMETKDLKLLQAIIGTRTPIGLSLYCSSFYLTRTVTAQAKYYAYQALLGVLTEYQRSDKKIFLETIENDIEEYTNNYEILLRQKVILPSSKKNLKSLTDNNFVSLDIYLRETEVSTLCTLDSARLIEIYHNYVFGTEKKNLEHVLMKANNMNSNDKHFYLEKEKQTFGYQKKIEETFEMVRDSEKLLLKIMDKSFFDAWYDRLLDEIFKEAAVNKKHIFHKEIGKSYCPHSENKFTGVKVKLATSFNKEIIRRVINIMLDDYLRISSGFVVMKITLLELMKFVNVDDYKGRMNYKIIKHRIISKAEEEILKLDDSSDDLIIEGLQYIKNNLDVSLLTMTEQNILNEIQYATKYEDFKLLSICNGGEFDDKFSLPTELSLSVIESLYKDMLWINLPLLELEEIKTVFSVSVSDDILKKMLESLDKYLFQVEGLKKTIVDGIFKNNENIEKLYNLEHELEFGFWKQLFHPIYYSEYKEIKNFIECRNFIENHIGGEKAWNLREGLEEKFEKLDRQKRDELKRILLSSIDNEFQTLAKTLIDFEQKLKGESTYWKKLLERKKNSLEKCIEALKKSVATGDDEYFYRAIKDIKNDSKLWWIFQLNSGLFKDIENTRHDSRSRVLTFRDLADGFITNRKEYLTKQQDDYKIRKANAVQQLVNEELARQNQFDQIEKERLNQDKQAAETRAEIAEAELKSMEAMLKMEREKKLKIKAKGIAIDLLFDEAIMLNIPIRKLKENQIVYELFKSQATLLVYNQDNATRLKNLHDEYLAIDIREIDFDNLAKLGEEFSKLSENCQQDMEVLPEQRDSDINKLNFVMTEKLKEVRDLNEKVKGEVEICKKNVEERIMQLQMEQR